MIIIWGTDVCGCCEDNQCDISDDKEYGGLGLLTPVFINFSLSLSALFFFFGWACLREGIGRGTMDFKENFLLRM